MTKKKLNLIVSKKEMRIDQYRTEPEAEAKESSKKLSEGRVRNSCPDLKATQKALKPKIAKDLTVDVELKCWRTHKRKKHEENVTSLW